MQPLLSIIVPCYNESKNIPFIVNAFTQITQQNAFVQVVIVNNGSTDDSALVLDEFIKKESNKQFKIVHVPINKGYGFGILEGLKMADADILSWTHADMQTNPVDVIKAYEIFVKAKNDLLVVKGNRKNRNLLDAFFTWGMQVYTNIKLKTALHDINAQPKLFSRKFYQQIVHTAPLDFSLDLYWLFMAKKIGEIKSFDVYFGKRLHGDAKGGGTLKGKWKLIKRTLHYINALQKTIHRN
jgi:glycosyltransferase involved in cell wall biosynthesis